MLKSVEYFFEGVYFFGGFLLYFPNMAIGSRTYLFDNVEASKNMTLNIGSV